jgi:hypothetical protein
LKSLQNGHHAVGNAIGNTLKGLQNGYHAAGNAIGNTLKGLQNGYHAVGNAIGNTLKGLQNGYYAVGIYKWYLIDRFGYCSVAKRRQTSSLVEDGGEILRYLPEITSKIW